VSEATVQSEIAGGQAVITGQFSVDEAKELARRLNEGALPAPISLISQQSVEASLGQESLRAGIRAGLIGLALVGIYMIFYYRFLGLVAAIALAYYAGLMITIFKISSILPEEMTITLTLSGIAGFILSVGMAVDANILIFERTKEEIRHGRTVKKAFSLGYKRAWMGIRDGNISTILTALILVYVGTGFVKGFSVILIIGVLFSMFTAVVLVRILLDFLVGEGQWLEKRPWLIGSGLKNNDTSSPKV
jgi:protein-export membrane protein SecD